jgi:hypothetical protein
MPQDKCPACKGSGSIALLVSVVKCDKCKGTGLAWVASFAFDPSRDFTTKEALLEKGIDWAKESAAMTMVRRYGNITYRVGLDPVKEALLENEIGWAKEAWEQQLVMRGISAGPATEQKTPRP